MRCLARLCKASWGRSLKIKNAGLSMNI